MCKKSPIENQKDRKRTPKKSTTILAIHSQVDLCEQGLQLTRKKTELEF